MTLHSTATSWEQPRIAPLEPPFAPDVERSLAGMMGTSSRPPLALFRTLLRNFEAGDRIRPLGSYLLTKGTIPPRERELVIHRVTARLGAEYEWGVHASIFGRALGLGDEWIDGTAAQHPDAATFDGREHLLVRLVDELVDTAHVSDSLWSELAAGWSEAQLIELLMLAGWYHLISFVANGLRIDLEPWARRFPMEAGG
jgi:4-carboxymuconolactone decarboxylase